MLPNVDTRDHNFIVIALEFVLTTEILMTNKNNEMLVYDAYAYFKHRILTDTSISWRCVLSKCNGRVRTFQDNVTIINDHSHFPDPADIEKRKFRTALKTRAVVSDEPPPSNNSFRTKRHQQRDCSSNPELFCQPEDN